MENGSRCRARNRPIRSFGCASRRNFKISNTPFRMSINIAKLSATMNINHRSPTSFFPSPAPSFRRATAFIFQTSSEFHIVRSQLERVRVFGRTYQKIKRGEFLPTRSNRWRRGRNRGKILARKTRD